MAERRQMVKIAHLLPMAPPKAIEELSPILDEEGIQNPIIVLKTNLLAWEAEMVQVPYILPAPIDTHADDVLLQIRCGHNRAEYCRRNGVEEIEAIILTDRIEAGEICKQQNKSHKQRHGPLI